VSTDAVRRVEIGSLAQGGVLGSGGQGQVTAVDNYQVDGKWPAVLKTYKSSVRFNARTLDKIVAFPDGLNAGDRDWLMATSAWPWAVATANGVSRGLLMRVVPGVYEFNFPGITLSGRDMLCTVEFLLNSDSYTSRAGISVNERDRLNFLGGLAETVSRLNTLGVVVGDLSPKNLLFNPNSYSDCFLIDCDAVALNGESALDQVDTPDWEVPPGEKKGTEASDSYKFGLLAIRLFAKDQSSRDISAISALSPELGRLAALSQDSDPLKRPAPSSWVSALQSATWSASRPPHFQTASVLAAAPRSQSANPPSRAGGGQQRSPGGVQRPASRPAARSRKGAKAAGWSIAAALVALVLIIVGINGSHHHTATLSSGSSGSGTTPDGSASQIPSSPPAPSPEPTQVGVVTLSDEAASDPAATTVAQMFNTYFTGINSRNYQQALDEFDPSGIVDPNDSTQAQSFIDGVKTSKDSNVTIVGVDPSDGSAVQSAELQFTSHQKAGYGPQDAPDETCTDWDVTYELTQDSSDGYLIYKVASGTDSGC
jgi:hypothetical protein